MNTSVVVRVEDRSVRVRLGRHKVSIPYEQITEEAVGPRTSRWQIGRRRLDDGSTGYLVGGSSVRISAAETSVVVSADESYRVTGAIQRRLQHVAEERVAGTEQSGR
ncbi:hypothetical protein [Kocuria aegyptia]|uniref:Uncharacterized protein n=1 Tax=Kocuria aegyptia TaxID=330943 RepID=A0ABP4WLM9_9MICC